jgi:hypothetical protein
MSKRHSLSNFQDGSKDEPAVGTINTEHRRYWRGHLSTQGREGTSAVGSRKLRSTLLGLPWLAYLSALSSPMSLDNHIPGHPHLAASGMQQLCSLVR